MAVAGVGVKLNVLLSITMVKFLKSLTDGTVPNAGEMIEAVAVLKDCETPTLAELVPVRVTANALPPFSDALAEAEALLKLRCACDKPFTMI